MVDNLLLFQKAGASQKMVEIVPTALGSLLSPELSWVAPPEPQGKSICGLREAIQVHTQ